MQDVIAAVATGKSPCAIGIVRLSGDGCAAVAGRVFTPDCKKAVQELPDRKLFLGTLRDRFGRVIDQAMVVYCRAPHSYTGEDTVELQCHGSPAMLAAALEALFAAGARQALPGEFTKRAFLNGQLDLTRAEAVIDLIDAESADAAANAAGQLGGALLRRIEPIYSDLTDLCSHFHALVDYPDEDIDPLENETFLAVLRRAQEGVQHLLSTYTRGQQLKRGVRTVLLGRPNVGKSSLFNALAGYDRVIVTDIAGTTRDTVEETLQLGHVLLRLTDTAGIRAAGDAVEAMGVARAEAAAQGAELVLFVCDGSQALTQEDLRAIAQAKRAPCAVALINKSDLPCRVDRAALPFVHVFSVSAVTGENLPALTAFLEEKYGTQAHCDGSLLTNPRQFDALLRADKALAQGRQALANGITADAVLTDVEQAMQALGEVTGHTVREDVTNRIFERFCVGK